MDFVNLPTPADPVHVIVERNGAIIDFDGDGVKDSGENRLADFGLGGNADLAVNAVVIHFNDVSRNALNLTGFGTDDKIEFDMFSMVNNNVLNGTAAYGKLDGYAEHPSSATYNLTRQFTFSSFLAPTPVIHNYTTTILVNQTPVAAVVDFGNNNFNNVYGLSLFLSSHTVSGNAQGAIAYWTDAGNALNDAANLLPANSGLTVLETLNSNAPHNGLVDFIWPVYVVVNETGAWLDLNGDGIKGGEDTFTVDVSAELANSPMTIHFNGMPSTPLDFAGFGADDRVIIDVDAMRYGNTTITRSNQTSYSVSSWTDQSGITGGYNTGSSYSAVFLSGSKFKYGHTFSSSYYTATRISEGTIAINATALANNYQPVMFVSSPGGPF